jgi:methyl-accepting chemotaxis protein
LAKLDQIGLPLSQASERVSAIEEKLGKDMFHANNQSYQSTRSLLLLAAAISLVLGIVISILIARGFSLPLGRAVAALELVAGGDLTVAVEVQTKDEVGRMSNALNVALKKLRSQLTVRGLTFDHDAEDLLTEPRNHRLRLARCRVVSRNHPPTCKRSS